MTPASAFLTGILHRRPRRFFVYLDSPNERLALLGAMVHDGQGYQPDADLLDSPLAERWPRGLDATASRRAIDRLGIWEFCRECEHPQVDEPCCCGWCATCELRAGIGPMNGG